MRAGTIVEFLADPSVKDSFYEDLNSIMGDTTYKIICTVIKKQELQGKDGPVA